MASRHVSVAFAGIDGPADEARVEAWARENDPTVAIPKWLMVLAARGEVTLRVPVSLEDDPLSELEDTASGD
jgi:hypothetical protein